MLYKKQANQKLSLIDSTDNLIQTNNNIANNRKRSLEDIQKTITTILAPEIEKQNM